MLIGHLPGIAAAMSGKRLDPTVNPNELNILAKHADYYEFKTYPWTFWILFFFLFSFSTFVLYLVMFVFHSSSYSIILLNTGSFLISFVVLYAGEIESLLINRKDKVVIHSWVNILLSKRVKKYDIKDLIKCEMIYKGHESRSNDARRYFIKLKFKGEKAFYFGECLSYRKVSEKYQKLMAIMKGELFVNVNKDKLKDTTTSFRDECSDEETSSLYNNFNKVLFENSYTDIKDNDYTTNQTSNKESQDKDNSLSDGSESETQSGNEDKNSGNKSSYINDANKQKKYGKSIISKNKNINKQFEEEDLSKRGGVYNNFREFVVKNGKAKYYKNE